MKKYRRQLLWIVLGTGCIALQLIGKSFPKATETLYGNGLFQVFRLMVDYSLAFLPFPLALLVFAFLVFLLVRFVRRLRKENKPLRTLLISIPGAIGMLITFFYLLWGWNYARPMVVERMSLDLEERMDSSAMIEEFRIATEELLQLVSNDSLAIREASVLRFSQWDKVLREDVEETLDGMGYSTAGRVQVRIINLRGLLLVWNTAGIYFPYSGEGHVDGGLLEMQIPSIVAHEMSHGYGVTDEGECNFVSWLACRRSDNAFVRYSSALSYWRQVAFSVRRSSPSVFDETFEALPPIVKVHLMAIRRNNDRFPEFFPRFRNITYDRYLKSQGVKGGLASYSRVVALVTAWRESEEN